MTTTLTPGGNAALLAATVIITASAGLDVTALVLSGDKVDSDADMVFFNQPSASGVRWNANTVDVNLGALRPGATKVVIIASPASEGQRFGQLGPVTVNVSSGGETITFSPGNLNDETALILCELYERNGQYKVRAVGQGYNSGLAGVATDFGISVDDDPAPVPHAAPAPPAPAATDKPRITFTKGEDKLPIDMRKALNLRKEKVAVVLEKHRMLGLQCRVIVVLDVSGSTIGLYKRGVFKRAVERVAPIAAQVDDGAEMQAWAMGSKAQQLPDITIGGLPQWLDEYGAKRYSKAGGANNEVSVMDDVRSYVHENPLGIPTLVLFFHDGGVTDTRGVTKAVEEAVEDPIFWQFVGLGRSNYGILQKLDNIKGRRVDNTGFFALDDIDTAEDADLYSRILTEFPDWMRSYYPAGHPSLAGLR